MMKPITWPTLHDKNCARRREKNRSRLDRAHRKSPLIDLSRASHLGLFEQRATFRGNVSFDEILQLNQSLRNPLQ